MMRLLIHSFVVCMFSIITLQAQVFEGKFVVQIMDEGSIARMNFMVKGDKIIIEPIDAALPKPIRMLLQKGNDNIYLLTEEQGMKVALSSKFKVPIETDAKKENKFLFEETGKKKKIGIYDCREVIVDNGEGQKLDMWVTSDMGFTLAQLFDNIGRLNGDSYMTLTKNNKEDLYKKNMALEINELSEGSTTQILIKDIEKSNLDAALFSLEGYTVMDMDVMKGK